MSNSPTFDLTAELLTVATAMDALAARGTVRLALKAAGLDASTVTSAQMLAVLRSVLPDDLTRRGVSDPGAVCARISERLTAANLVTSSDGADRAASIFERFGPR